MEDATTAPPSSGHQKRYVPIVAGTLGGCGLALIVGCLFCLFLRRRRQRYGPGSPDSVIRWPLTSGHDPESSGFEPSYRPSDTRVEPRRYARSGDPAPSSRGEIAKFTSHFPLSVICAPHVGALESDPDSGFFFNNDLETGIPWDWDANLDLSDLGALPFANVDFETIFDLDHQNLTASSVPVSSALKPSREEEFPLGNSLELGVPVDEDLNACLSGSRALHSGNSDALTNITFDHQNSSPTDLPATSDPVPSRKDDFLAWCTNPSISSQPEMVSNPPSAPSAFSNEQPDVLISSRLPTNVEPSISHPQSQALEKPLPLPPAPNFRCPNCPRKFSSRARLESVSFLQTSL